jgi:hypothetical protein
MITEAGRGEHHVYKIVPNISSDQAKLTAGNHYVGIDAVAWFINKRSDWFTDYMASGTLDIKLSDGLEDYPVALGTFNLSGGARTAPVFEKPVLSDRNYRGGRISFCAMLSAMKKDTVMGGMLKSAASASLGIVAGMVQTASLTGPAGILGAAGQDLIGGVRKVLTDTTMKCEPIFEFTGLEYYLLPENVVGPQIFILLHRGAHLNESSLSINTEGQLSMPFYENALLEDGAWLMLRIRRSDEYSGIRDWFTDTRKLRSRVKALVDDVNRGRISEEAGLAEFKLSGTGDKTAQDEFIRLRSVISNDGVLSEREAGAQVGLLSSMLEVAKDAVTKANPQILASGIDEIMKALSTGHRIEGDIGQAFADQVTFVASARKMYLVKDTSPKRITKLHGDELFSTMQYMPKTLKSSKQLDNLL